MILSFFFHDAILTMFFDTSLPLQQMSLISLFGNQSLNEGICVWKSLKKVLGIYCKQINKQKCQQSDSAEVRIEGEIIIDASGLLSLKHSGQTSEEQKAAK